MRIDIDTFSFSGVVDQGLLTMLDLSGAEYAAVGIIFTAFANSPTLVRVEGAMADSIAGTNVFTDGDVFGTPDLTGAPVAAPKKTMISRVGLAGASKAIAANATMLSEGFLLPPPLKYFKVYVGLTGAGATATGTVVVFKYTR